MPPSLRDGLMDHHHLTSKGAGVVARTSASRKHALDDDQDPSSTNQGLFGDIPEGRRRKFILVEDAQRGCRVRVKVMLDQVDINEIPDSYRKSNSVFPRTYFPVHGPFGHAGRGGRFESDDHSTTTNGEAEGGSATVGRTFVPVPLLEGEGTLAVPKISRNKRQREVVLNDLGYRMSWGQSRVFAGRTLFLQRACKSAPCYSPTLLVSCLLTYVWVA
jgi:hypothetical protein